MYFIFLLTASGAWVEPENEQAKRVKSWLANFFLFYTTPLLEQECAPAVNPLNPGIFFGKPTPRISASLGHTGHLPNRLFSVCGLAGRARFALHGEKAHCSVACSSIHASTFLWPGLQTGPLWSWWFSCKFGLFISWQHTKVNHHIYKSQGKPSFIVFTRALAEYNSWKAGGRMTIFTAAIPASRRQGVKLNQTTVSNWCLPGS